jgi:hypothetical protein
MRARWDPSKLNGWKLYKSGELEFPAYEGGGGYPLDISDCTSSAKVLDWICQVAHKTWADDACVAGLVRALDEILDPQANLCSCGRDKQMTRAAVRGRIKRKGQ